MVNSPLTPQDEGTIPVLAGVASARVSMSAWLGDQLELHNSGTAYVFIRFGPSTVAATTGTASATTPTAGSYVVEPGIVKVITRPTGATHMAHISTSASQTLYVTPCNGV